MCKLKAVFPFLYLLTGIVCLYWSALTFFAGIYGIGFPWWALIVALGSLGLIAGAILTWASISKWSERISTIGACILAAYFVPALYVSLRLYLKKQVPYDAESVLELMMALLALATFFVAVRRQLGPIGR